MVSRKLLGVWAFFDVCLLAAGAVTVALSIVWRAPNLLMNMVFSRSDLTAGLALGISLLITFAISIGAIIQPNHVTLGLVLLNWTLVLDGVGIIVIGSFIWFYTLQERNNFDVLFTGLSAAQRVSIQDQLQCCGYFGVSDAEIGGSYCQNSTFVQTSIASAANFCVDPITDYADRSLNAAFTTVFGFMAIIICLLLASLCVIKKRLEDERFKKIDAKRGGSGFV
jgi:hypothetical protein